MVERGEAGEAGTIDLPDDEPHELIPRVRLTIVDGAGAGTSWMSDSESAVVGTHSSAALVLADPTASRFHFELRLGAGGIFIRDLGSRNGTRVSGVRVLEARLHHGAEITAGRTRLRFDLVDEKMKLPIAEEEWFGSLVGRSRAMRRIFALLRRAAASELTVLLEGETGTGKEAAAGAIHAESARKEGPLFVVDCSALPPDLLESELFGHQRGAFTGAVADRRGAFEAASGGTLFLDEIGELPAQLQPKLLRVLENREVRPLGGNETRRVNVRIVAATNRDLRAEVNAGRFRADLYYRLAVLEIRLPPLRERAEDIPSLVEHILARARASGDEAERLRNRDLQEELSRHQWPGNVRELRNYVERCLAFRELVPTDGRAASDGAGAEVSADAHWPFRRAREAFERRYLAQLLALHDNNVAAAARAAEIDRIHLYRLLSKHGLR